jgi:uncharacterized protein (TIGR04255 family)
MLLDDLDSRRTESEMPWKIEPQPARVYERNPLAVVLAQVRFHPILRVGQRVSEYQDLVRQRFPAYHQQQVQSVEMLPAGIQVKAEAQHVFSDPKRQTALFLTNTALTLESREHNDRATFRESMVGALEAFLELHRTFQGTRFGVRYINIIRPEEISHFLGREVGLEGLVGGSYRHLPGTVTLDRDTRFSGEVVSGVREEGYLTLRYAWRQKEYHLDFDRYFEGVFDPGEVEVMLEAFTQDIFEAYLDVAGPDLVEWMEKVQEAVL